MTEVTRDQTGPHIKQLSFFLPNRLGALLRATRGLEADNIKICSVSILDAADHAVVRMVVDRPALAMKALQDEGYNVFETEVLGVALPLEKGIGIQRVLSALLIAEVNIHYVYSLMVQSGSHPVLALHVDDMRAAEKVLRDQGLELVGQDELSPPEEL
jgi:hypothetical protein